MAKKDDTHPILQEIKNTAKEHQAFEKERGKDLIYGHALDIASKKLVNIDWNTACAMAKKGTLSIHNEPINTESMFKINFPDVREGVLFPHQIEAMIRQMELGTFDSKGKTIIFPDVDPLTKEVAEATRETLRALVESGEMIDTAGMDDDEIVKAFYDLINKDKTEYTPVLIPANEAHSYIDQTSAKIEDAMRYVRDGRETHILSGTQSLSDFTQSSKNVANQQKRNIETFDEALKLFSTKPTVTIIGTNDVSKEEMSRIVELANSGGELEFEEFDMRQSSTQDKANSYMEAVKANVGLPVTIIEDNKGFVIPDFHPPKPQKMFYTKRNHLMSEHESIISDPNFEEIPYELESIDEMNAWIEKQGGGALFFPTNSIADLKASMEAEQSAVESSINYTGKNNFFKYLNADHTKSKMKKGR